MKTELQLLNKAPKEQKPQLFLAYCRTILDETQNGRLSAENAGYQIAETMFIDELKDPLFDKIVATAGSLELPKHVSGSDPQKLWDDLIRLIDEYAEHIQGI